MTPRQKRFAWIASGLAALVLVAGLLLYALNSNIVFFYTPTQVSQGEAPSGRAFRIGGLVEPGSLKRDGTRVEFVVTDGEHQIAVSYVGTLPDLFREGPQRFGDDHRHPCGVAERFTEPFQRTGGDVHLVGGDAAVHWHDHGCLLVSASSAAILLGLLRSVFTRVVETAS